MEDLRASDLRAAMAFVEEAWTAAGERAFPVETLDGLMRLIPCDSVTYNDLDRLRQNAVEVVSTEEDAGDADSEVLFWSIAPEHPLCCHQQLHGDFSATRLSDVVTRRRLLASRVYAEWFRPYSIVAELEAGIASTCVHTRAFILDRSSGDFSRRDRAVLDFLRPHLARIHEMTELRRVAGAGPAEAGPALTRREAEILELVGEGLTNAAIAQRLRIASGTVKKHLDNVYEKLGVSSRAAAVARVTRMRSSRALNAG